MSFLLFGMILDYARIHAVLADERRMLVALREGIRFTFKNFLSTFGLALLLFIIGLIVLVIYNPLVNSLGAPTVLIVTLLFLLQQFYMILRMMLRLTSYASQLDLYRQLAIELEPAAATTASIGDLEITGLAPE